MKKYVWLITFLISINYASAQTQVTGWEYWFDNNYSQKVTQNTGATSLLVIDQSIDISALGFGLHTVHFRFKDERGIWSPVTSRFFTWYSGSGTPELREITGFEYWYDNNYASVTSENINSNSAFNIEQNLDVSGLNYGLHAVHFRFKDERGIWSPVVSKFFTWYPDSETPELREIAAYEYWYDNSYESVISENIASSTSFNIEENLDISELNYGLHTVHFRFKDERGIWGPVVSRFFAWYPGSGVPELRKITALEYWFNNDYSSVSVENISASAVLGLEELLDVKALKDGLHVLNYRFKDEKGGWSSALSKFFVKYAPAINYPDNEIVEYRYWIDDEITTLKSVELETPVKNFVLQDNLDVDDFPSGEHFVNIQFKDKLGHWSSAIGDTVILEPKISVDLSVSSINSCFAEGLTFTANTIDVTDILWDFGDGSTSTEFNPVHAYDTVGKFEVTVTATHSPSGTSKIFTLADSISVFPTYSSRTSTTSENTLAYYPFNGNANDESGKGHNGEIFGATSIPDRFGNPGAAYLFDGDNDYIDVGDWENGGATTFVFWARWDAFNNYSRIIDFGNGPSSNNMIVSNYQTNNNLLFSNYNNTVEKKYYLPAITLGKWDFYATAVDENGVMTVYKNGEQIGQKTDGFTPTKLMRTAQYFGKSNFSADGYFKGAIDDIIVYNVALTASEINGIFNQSSNYIPPVQVEICSSEIPFVFGTQSLSKSGTYTETFHTVYGCDSIVTLNLTVNPSYEVNSGQDFLIDDDFESDTPGTMPAGWVLKYNGTGNANQKVVNSPVKNGSQAFQMEGASGWASEFYKRHEIIPDTLVLEAWVNCEKILSGLAGSIGVGNFTVGTWGTRTSRLQFNNGKISATYSGGPTHVIMDYVPGEWYHCKMVHNLTDKTYRVYINDILVSGTSGTETIFDFPMHATVETIDVMLAAGNSGTNKMFFDDIKMADTSGGQIVICENDLPYKFGTQLLTQTGEYTEIFQTVAGCDSIVHLNLLVNPSYARYDTVEVCDRNLPFIFGTQTLNTSGDFSETYQTVSACDSIIFLSLKVIECPGICTELQLNQGWNIFSANSTPDSTGLKYVFQPLIDKGSLVKIQDELGNSLEDWGIFGGWTNNIGDINPGEGYKIKVSFSDSIEICGLPVQYPFSIPLEKGWNIMGYPQTASFDGMENIVQQLINNGSLVKVQDEQGNSIEDWAIFGGWTNNIGDFIPGEGYKIKVNTEDTLWIYESYPKSTTILPQQIATTHFKTDFEGNGIDHMNFNLVGLPISLLRAGDELAIFDGTSCVGAITIMPHHLQSQTVSIATSASDNQGMAGFEEGNPVKLKMWNSGNHKEFNLEPEIVKGTSTFVKHETTVASLEKYATTGLEGFMVSGFPEIRCYPNPFSAEVTIEIKLLKDSEISVEVMNQLGQQVKYLSAKKQLSQGIHQLTWNGKSATNQQVSSGIYYVRIEIGSEIYFKKVVYSKIN